MKMGGTCSRVAYIFEPALKTKPATRVFSRFMPEEQQDFISILLVVNNRLVCPAFALPIPVQVISFQPVTILSHIGRLLLGNKEPYRLLVFGTEHAIVNCRVINLELLAQGLAGINSAAFELVGTLHFKTAFPYSG